MGKINRLIMKLLLQNPLFLIGLFIRLVMVLTVFSVPVTQWYAPFLEVSTNSFGIDPWEVWLNQNGAAEAFPYGYVMWLCFLPLALMCKWMGLSIIYGYGLTLIAADFSLLLILRKLIDGRDRLLLGVYWLSPIVLVASYLLGFNDLIPVLFLVIALYFASQTRLLLSGLVCIAAVSAKLSMIMVLPFFLIYLLHNKPLRQYLPKFLIGVVIGVAIMLLPFIFSSAGLSMLFNNPEMGKVYRLAINLGDGGHIYIVPLVYLSILYAVWRIKRLNFELFHVTLGITFLLVVLSTPASPGWFIWAIPLLVAYQSRSDRIALILTALFSALFVLMSISLAITDGLIINYSGAWYALFYTLFTEGKLASLVHTAMVSVGIILVVRIWRESVSRNDFFRLSRKPFVIGVAGDSGAGKDTFSDAIEGLFGSHSVATISGDDYHLWDRQKPMWQVMTHLNPLANDLEGFANDLVNLTDGKSVQTRHYNHNTGRMSRPYWIKSNDIIIASGLHALYLPIIRECCDLGVYLDIDEGLRQHFKLQRDVHQRGHTVEKVLSSFDRREPDSERFIRPQASNADLILSLQPIHPRMLEEGAAKHSLRFKLVARSCNGLNERSLVRVLIGICGLHVDLVSNNDGSEIILTIEGENSAEDIALAAKMICPEIFEFLDIKPKWQDGVMGLMQLITLSHINQVLTKRFIR